jgi:lipoprotein-anchoring transpeptidase ErfK/SrfK
MQGVGTTALQGASRSARIVAIAAGSAALMVLAACTSGASKGNGNSPVSHDTSVGKSSAGAPSTAASTPKADAAVITVPAAAAAISPIRPVVVGIAHGTLTAVRMTNPAGKQVAGALAGDGSSWRSTEVLGYSKSYTIVASGKGADGSPVSKTSRVSTVTPNNETMPYIDDVYGSSVDGGATYGVGMIVKVHFDESVNRAKAQRTLHVTTTPSVVGGWYWDDDQNAYWRPKNYYTPGTTVTVTAKVYGVDVGSGLYGQDDRSVSFKIGEKRVSIADASTHHVKVYFSDRLVRSMPTSMGRGGTVQGRHGTIYLWTMPGTYTVLGHENPATMSSDSYGLPANSPLGYAPEKVPFATKISTDGIYLHELDTTLWAQGNSNVSHGCLNLNYTNAKWYFDNSRVGDVVKVINSGGPHIQFWQGGQWDVPWSQWLTHSAL